MFRFLFKYIDLFDPSLIKKQGLIHYDVVRFDEEINEFAISKKLTNYSYIIEKQVNEKSDSIDVFYKILEYVRRNRIYGGTLNEKIEDGTIHFLHSILKTKLDAIGKAVEYLANLPKKQETSIVECFDKGAHLLLEFDCSSKESFYLLNEFELKRKEKKIRVHHIGDNLPIGMPWVAPFYKI